MALMLKKHNGARPEIVNGHPVVNIATWTEARNSSQPEPNSKTLHVTDAYKNRMVPDLNLYMVTLW